MSCSQNGAAVRDGARAAVVVGTAGHVDHGKSSLVQALTGTDPDRLPQEKARGITIDLGFAELVLPSGRAVGLVDVPGHEHYVRAMAAGAAGVDVALLVVAADDGVMPQTREHLRILSAMGARRMVVALTKSDLVEPDWLELVQMDVAEYLEDTPYAGAEVVAVSSRTGDGLPHLLACLDAQVGAFLESQEASARLARPARLAVDRAFNVAGSGAVVTGTLRAGVLRPGDEVDIMPAGVRARVRGIQTHGRDVACAVAGQRTAVNLAGATLGQVPRGSTVCAPRSLRAHDRFDARLHWFGRDGEPAPLVSGERVHVCAGTSQALGRILLFDGAAQLPAGEDALVQVRLETPLVLAAHDRFVAMAYSPVELVGGGEILWCAPPRRSVPGDAERDLLAAMERADERAAVLACVRRERFAADAACVASSLDLAPARVGELLGELVEANEIVALPVESGAPRYIAPALFEDLVARAVGALKEGSARHGATVGMTPAALRDLVGARIELPVFACVVNEAERRGLVGRFDANLVAGEDLERVRRETDELVGRVAAALEAHGDAVPFADELAAELDLPEAAVRRGLTKLVEAGRAVAVERAYALPVAVVERFRATVAQTISAAGGTATTSELREAMGLTRKYALPLLEYFDRAGFTVRADDGQARSLARP